LARSASHVIVDVTGRLAVCGGLPVLIGCNGQMYEALTAVYLAVFGGFDLAALCPTTPCFCLFVLQSQYVLRNKLPYRMIADVAK